MIYVRIASLFILACLLTFPWITLSAIGVAYVVSIPFGIGYFNSLKTDYETKQGRSK